MVWKHQLKTPPPKKTSSECLLPPLYLILWVSAPMESLAFQAAECESDRLQSACQQKSRHDHHQNYSNWATAGDSSSCQLPIGPENQNTGVALCLGSVSAAQRKWYRLSGIHGYSRIFFSCFMCQPKSNFLRLANLQTPMSPRSGSNIKGSSCFFRWRQHWNHDKRWFSSTK